jgi:UDPglucose 6-dehydrogenase
VYLVPKILDFFQGNLQGRQIALWGLAFKPNTDDIREAPALYIIEALLQEGATIHAFDPEAMGHVRTQFGDRIRFGTNQYEVLEGADAVVIATEWSVFRTPDFDKMAQAMKQKVVFDGRNVFEREQMQALGFHYVSVGRQPVTA